MPPQNEYVGGTLAATELRAEGLVSPTLVQFFFPPWIRAIRTRKDGFLAFFFLLLFSK